MIAIHAQGSAEVVSWGCSKSAGFSRGVNDRHAIADGLTAG